MLIVNIVKYNKTFNVGYINEDGTEVLGYNVPIAKEVEASRLMLLLALKSLTENTVNKSLTYIASDSKFVFNLNNNLTLYADREYKFITGNYLPYKRLLQAIYECKLKHEIDFVGIEKDSDDRILFDRLGEYLKQDLPTLDTQNLLNFFEQEIE